jgi:hypothetical protein
MQRKDDVVVVTGGTQYSDELEKHGRLLRQINSFSRRGAAGKVDKRPSDRIDGKEDSLRQAILQKVGNVPAECDDLHILALCADANVDVVFSKDERMKQCIDKIRGVVGHRMCPKPTFVRTLEDFQKVFG